MQHASNLFFSQNEHFYNKERKGIELKLNILIFKFKIYYAQKAGAFAKVADG